MSSLQRTLKTIALQLKELTPTAKLLLGSLMVILIMSLFLVSLYASRRDLVPLGLSGSVSSEARAQAVSHLSDSNIPYEVVGSDIQVPPEQRDSILAYLTESELIGADQINFDRLMADDNVFRTRHQDRQRYLVAKMNVLSNMIAQMSGIERATVVLDAAESSNGFARSHVPPSASVTVLSRGRELGQTQVDAIARLVAGSHAGLKPQRVAVIDARTGRAMQARTDDDMSAGKHLEVRQEAEKHIKAKLENALGYIPGVRIEVSALVDTKQVVQQTSKYDEPKVGILEDLSHAITSSSGSGAAEPGVRSNVGANISVTASSPVQMSDERTQTSSVPFVGSTESHIRDSKGYALQVNASIGVPKSYFVRLYQDQQGDSELMPQPQELDGIIQVETDRIRSTVLPLNDTQALEGAVAGTVAVTAVPDFNAVLAGDRRLTELVSSGDSLGGTLLNGDVVKYASLGALAILSLGMMFLMVRKASTREVMPTASELVGVPPALAAAESDLVGEADEASTALEGVELNDDAIRRQQMLEQITEMVTASPDDAANLLRRWIKSET